MSQDRYFLGIDGGGSKTEAAVINDNEQVLGMGWGGGSNTCFTSASEAAESFISAISQALTKASLTAEKVTGAGCTFCSAAVRIAFNEIGIGLRPMPIGEWRVAIERAGIVDRVGVTVIGGTGSSCFGRNREGKMAHTGGWGAVLGDDGSGYDIGRRAVRRVLWASEGRMPPTSLTEKALDYFSAKCPREIVESFSGTRVNQSFAAGFAKKVSEAAEEGDEAAIEILRDAGRELAQLALFVAGRIFGPEDEFPLVLAGGVFDAGEALFGEIEKAFAKAFPCCRIVKAAMNPGEAAARIVRRAYYKKMGSAIE